MAGEGRPSTTCLADRKSWMPVPSTGKTKKGNHPSESRRDRRTGDVVTMTKRRPVSLGKMLETEFMTPLGLTQTTRAGRGYRAAAVNELRNGRRAVTVDTAPMRARVFGNTPDFQLDAQRRTDLWQAWNSPARRKRIERARPVKRAPRRAGRLRSHGRVR
jgi:antitoxin HigA-1